MNQGADCASLCSLPWIWLTQLDQYPTHTQKKEKLRPWSEIASTFIFCRIFMFLFSSVGCIDEKRRRSNLLFSLWDSRGLWYFQLPFCSRMNHQNLAVNVCSSVPRITFKWNQMAVHSEVINSDDGGNKHIAPLLCWLAATAWGCCLGAYFMTHVFLSVHQNY